MTMMMMMTMMMSMLHVVHMEFGSQVEMTLPGPGTLWREEHNRKQ